jgi:hypothetical protein
MHTQTALPLYCNFKQRKQQLLRVVLCRAYGTQFELDWLVMPLDSDSAQLRAVTAAHGKGCVVVATSDDEIFVFGSSAS